MSQAYASYCREVSKALSPSLRLSAMNSLPNLCRILLPVSVPRGGPYGVGSVGDVNDTRPICAAGGRFLCQDADGVGRSVGIDGPPRPTTLEGSLPRRSAASRWRGVVQSITGVGISLFPYAVICRLTPSQQTLDAVDVSILQQQTRSFVCACSWFFRYCSNTTLAAEFGRSQYRRRCQPDTGRHALEDAAVHETAGGAALHLGGLRIAGACADRRLSWPKSRRAPREPAPARVPDCRIRPTASTPRMSRRVYCPTPGLSSMGCWR